MSTAARAALGAALLIAAIVLFVVLQGGDDNGDGDGAQAGNGGGATQAPKPAEPKPKPSPPPVPTIVVRGGAPVGGPMTIEADSGERVRFRVSSDTADEIHVHGYDVTKAIPAGAPVAVSFDADLEGIFEVELHGSGEQIAELQVGP
jgi:hypothetical protein